VASLCGIGLSSPGGCCSAQVVMGSGSATKPNSTQRPPVGREPPPAGKRKREGIQLCVLQQTLPGADLMPGGRSHGPQHCAPGYTHPGDPPGAPVHCMHCMY
jgi:hypothetical protein